jgi:N6-adenosine-specific RNA methylase IME4
VTSRDAAKLDAPAAPAAATPSATWEGLSPPYSTIVADPPWSYDGGVSAGGTPGKPVKSFDLPYQGMALDAIKALPVADLAARDCWLFLWTTNRYLPAALDVLVAWGFRYRQTLVWNKPGASPFGGTVAPNGGEFLLVAAKGSPPVLARWNGTSILTHSRPGAGKHSTKPDAFGDLVEHCCPGPYVELFCRRPRLGWDSWGKGYELPAVTPRRPVDGEET